eukprot:g14487.t1
MIEQQPVVADLLQALTEKDDKVLPNLKASLNSMYEELKHGVMKSADAGNTTAPLEDATQRILLAATYRVAEKVFDLPVTAPTKSMKGVLPFLLGFTKQVVAVSVGTANILVGGGGGNKFAAPAQSAVVAVLKKLFEEADEKSASAVEKFGHVGRGLLTKAVLDAAALDAAGRKRVREHRRIWMQGLLLRGRLGLLDLAQEHEEAAEAFQREHGEGIAAKLEELDKKFAILGGAVAGNRFPRGNAAAINAAREERRAAFFALVEEVSADFESPMEAANTLMGGRFPESPLKAADAPMGQAQGRLPEEEEKLPAWIWVLIIVGAVVLGAIVGVTLCCCCSRNTNAAADQGPVAGGGRFSMDSYFSDSDLEI